ncbi:MAG: ABC transporter ATP-binding protein [Chloroflexi bacterium]|nr:ABC transporter ATP-binding protein [Chloroflexota bacterium]
MELEIKNLTAGYAARPVLRDINLRAAGGEVLGLIGANGAGKSTLVRVIAGTLSPRAGRVLLDGADLARLDARRRAQRIAVVPQGARLPDAFSVLDMVLMGRNPYLSLFGRESAHDVEIARHAMAQTDIAHLADTPVGELSGGEQQRVLLARALAQAPQVLLLDEATAHLDLKHQSDILQLARRMARECGLIVIAALHDLNLAALYADRIALLSRGALLALDTPEAVLTPALLQAAYDVPVVVSRHPIHHTPLVALASDRDGEGPAVQPDIEQAKVMP